MGRHECRHDFCYEIRLAFIFYAFCWASLRRDSTPGSFSILRVGSTRDAAPGISVCFIRPQFCSTVVVGLKCGFILDHMSGWLSVAGWRWMFLVQAAPTIVLGGLVLYILPDGPRSAPWLSPEQRSLHPGGSRQREDAGKPQGRTSARY